MNDREKLAKQIAAQLEESILKLTKYPVVNQNDFYIRRLLTIFSEIENHFELSYATVDERSLVGDFFLCWWENDVVDQDRVLTKWKSWLQLVSFLPLRSAPMTIIFCLQMGQG